MIYIASPNTHPDPAVRQQRFEDVCHYVADRMLQSAVRYGRCRSRMPAARRRTPYGQLCRRSVARIISQLGKLERSLSIMGATRLRLRIVWQL